MASDADAVHTVFGEARETFIRQLNDNEKAQILSFKSMDDMLQSIKIQSENHFLHRSRYKVCAQKIRRFSEKFAPFFEVINIFVQTHPEYSGLVWGTVRLIFQLGSHYITFLEKLANSFEQIGDQLPAYAAAIDSLKSLKTRHGKRFDRRLLTSLSLVYKDVMEFCYKAYKLLSPGKGFQERSRMIWKISSQPFDDHFGGVHRRLRWHSQLFNQEVQISQIELGSDQLETSREQRDQLYRLYNVFEQEMMKAQQHREKHNNNWQRDETEVKLQKIQRLKDWIDAPNWEEAHYAASTRRQPGSTDWFFSEPSYKSWWSQVTESWTMNQKADHNILLVQGKPGYGKTHLCSSLIDRLRSGTSEYLEDPATPSLASNVFYYYFDTLKPWRRTVMDAFRAILTQALHTHRDDNEAIDAACLMMYHGISGQKSADEKEILTLLNWYLRRHRNTILVFDGLDEVNDPKAFLRHLEVAVSEFDLSLSETEGKFSLDSFAVPKDAPSTNVPNLAVVIFTRPSIVLPRHFLQQCYSLSLRNDQNLAVIEAYLLHVLEQLVDNYLLEEDEDMQLLAKNAAAHAGGMFLWARLLEGYLNAEGLSVQERLDALNNIVYFEGLDNLYDVILNRLQKTLPLQVRVKVKKAFQWTDGAVRPLYIEEFNEAITLPTDKASGNTRIPNIRQAIMRMSGALLEIAADDSICFIHSSLSEYLRQSRRTISKTNREHDFYLQPRQTTQYLGACCISYLTCCLPSGPLSGTSSVTADPHFQSKRFPFLSYVLKFWDLHVSSAIKSISPSYDLTESHQLVVDVRNFLLNKKAVMTWIEASWLFHLPPRMNNVVEATRSISFSPNTLESISKNIRDFSQDVHDFARDLDRLNRDWHHVLSKTSNEIWEPSILSICKSRFWLSTKDATYTSVISSWITNGRVISLQSKASSDGSEVGLVSLIAPSLQTDDDCMDCLLPEVKRAEFPLAGWRVSFEVWDLSSKRTKFKVYADISRHDISSHFQRCANGHYLPLTNLRIPLAISDDLRKVQVIHDLIVIRRLCSSLKSADARGCVFDCISIDPWGTGDMTSSIQVTSIYGVLFDPHGRYLLFAHSAFGLAVFGFSDSGQPLLLAETHELGLLEDMNLQLSQIACFHPFLPALVVAGNFGTVAWNFLVPGKSLATVSSQALKDLKFSNCGHYILGKGREMTFINVFDAIHGLFQNRAIKATTEPEASPPMEAKDSEKRAVPLRINNGRCQPTVRVQHTNAVTFSRDDGSGQASMSILRQLGKEGTLLLTTLSGDGTAVRTETITRLPRSLNISEAVLVSRPSQSDDDTVRVVINVKQRERYGLSLADMKQSMPVVLERKKESIPVFKTRMRKALNVTSDLAIRALQGGAETVKNQEYREGALDDQAVRRQAWRRARHREACLEDSGDEYDKDDDGDSGIPEHDVLIVDSV